MWTKNYKNLVKTVLTCGRWGQTSTSETSTAAFSDEYFFNYKAPDGKIYDIMNRTTSFGRALPVWVGDSLKDNRNFTKPKLLTTPTTSFTSMSLDWYLHVGFGSDSTTPTELDYKLGSHITTISEVNLTATNALNTNGTFTTDCEVIVKATADITINEIGLFLPVYRYAPLSGSGTGNYVLMNRIVLDEPVSIATDEVATVRFSITTPEINFS